ncbi:ABC-type transport auxiliary lipoprotein family protein [Govanella unica]|uniref:ABC-type transport auxiliary lipoprotein family protein n=1 Tax=Govanella unica TaxID=2975056 RepID=A0A9X3TXH9_9PROT|nr:ABC-type transport auxiliary lipoprotein family protein [Govania unica]MDA5193434.1 ABC-type transport auxiliary lipoprotein family protein [Govania unica]
MTPMTRIATGGLCAAILVVISGCGPLISVGGDKNPPIIYTLSPAEPVGSLDRPPLPVTLVVSEPSASDALDSRRLALMPSELQIQYYAGARWSDRAPALIQNLLVSAFTGIVANVTANSMPVTPDYRLTSRLVSFETHYPTANKPVAVVALDLQLFSARPLALVATTRITNEQTASADKTDAVARAFNNASQVTAQAAVTWAYDEMAKQATQGEK